ncbi:non-ribosomal peptide synthetase module [Ophiobolus disseminans]|uniref:Non-ribosomal peptide synthetase module n=1 Tax=Ophiobolus disseminans TaxID=1469910 RepID=A0A6A6ZRL8_9PLEO|nr:non-ribosomal peptide synthetase module [Ophiobolus disseminans]
MAVIVDAHVDNGTSQKQMQSKNELEPPEWTSNYESVRDNLRTIWAELLNDDPSMFSDEDVFFEVGGDSISAQKLVTAAQGYGIHLTVEKIFLHASLSEMAEVAITVPIGEGAHDVEASARVNPLPSSWLLKDTEIDAIARQCNIAAEELENTYPCTPMQESLLAEFDDGKNQYVRQFVFKLPLALPFDCFRQAWEETVRANPILRTRICHLGSGTGYAQAVLRGHDQWNLLHVNLDRFLEWDATNRMYAGSPLVRYTILANEDDQGYTQRYFVWTIHHSVCDGATVPEILNDVSRRYHGLPVQNRASFESFIRSPAVMVEPSSEQEFWKRALSGINPTPYPPLPQDPAFRAAPTSVFERSIFMETNPSHGVTKALLLRAAWAILLSHYNGTEDIGFGAINNGRTAPGVSHVTGPTITLVPIALHVDPKETVYSFLSRIRTQAAEMMPFEHAGISRIRKHLADADSTALNFQTLFVVHPMSFTDAIARSMQALGLEYFDEVGRTEIHQYPLVLTFTLSTTQAVKFTMQHDERVLSTQQVRNIAHHFQVVLTQLSRATRSTRLEEISSFGEHDLDQIRLWNKYTPPVEEICIHDLFQKQVILRPNSIAVCSLNDSLTYRDVDLHSSSLARQLVDCGVRRGTYVGVCFDKSIWTVVASIAVFKAGGVYVPVDPAHPQSRIEEVVKAAHIEIALASRVGTEALHQLCRYVVTVDGPPPSPSTSEVPVATSLPSSIAYLLFTSGSTGKPKGILMSHQAICTSIIHHGAAFAAGPHWRTLQFCAHTFDISIAEFFTTLAHGGCICVPSEHDRLHNLAGAITSLNANTLLVVPTVANLLYPDDVPTLKTMILSGEPITKETVSRWAGFVDLTCAYGPSETAVWSSANLRVSADSHPGNIGRGIGTTTWIVDPNDYHQLSAIGCVGELVMSGAHLGAGYLGDKVSTDAAFLPAPAWLRNMDPKLAPHSMIYRSGDLGRYNPDGTFQIVGRRDTQVKLRGFRIELGEIENQLMTINNATAALATLPKSGPCARQLVAVVSFTKPDLRNHNSSDIIVSRQDTAMLEDLKTRLLLVLPEYMVPSVWVVLPDIPLLISGKIDRKSINTWVHNLSHDEYLELTDNVGGSDFAEVLPQSLADTLRLLWSAVLNVPVESINRNTSFIAIGGDSIAAIQIVSRAKKGGLSVTVRDLVSTRSLGVLEKLVEHRSHSRDMASTEVEPVGPLPQITKVAAPFQQILVSRLAKQPLVQVEDVYPLAPFQREMIRARKVDRRLFLMSWEMEVWSLTSDPISLERLARAWKRVIQRFPILRSIFLSDPTDMLDPVQIVLSNNAEPEVAISSAEADEDEPCFSSSSPSVNDCFLPHRAHFSRHGERYYAHIEIYHLAIDGWSSKLLQEALLSAYDNPDDVFTLKESASYKAFVSAHRPDRINADDKHWALALHEQRPCLLSLPVANPVPPSFNKTIIYLPEIKAQSLRAFSSQKSITPASIWDAAWAQTLSAYTGSSDVAFEYVISGRDDNVPNVFDIVGPLINVLPYHVQGISAESGPEELARLAQRMQEQRIEDSHHTASNVREVIEQQMKGAKLFNTALNFMRRPSAVRSEKTRVDDNLRKSRDPWHFDVLVRILYITDDDTFRPSFEFDAHLFDASSMKAVADCFWGKVKSITS